VSERMKLARELPKEGLKREVERHLTRKETGRWEIIYFKLYVEHSVKPLQRTARIPTSFPQPSASDGKPEDARPELERIRCGV